MREGDDLVFTIHRNGKEERPHSVAIGYSGAGLLNAPVESVDFSASSRDETVTLHTAEGTPGDGDHMLRIVLKTDPRAKVGNPGSADVIVRDDEVVHDVTTPPASAEPTGYTVDPPEAVERGTSLLFTVVRHGPATASPPSYRLVQQGWAIRGDWQQLAFEGGDRTELKLPANYDPCGEPPTLLIRSEGNATLVTAANFSGGLPNQCKPGLLEWLLENAPWWPIPAAVVVLGTLGYLGRRLIPWPKPTLYATSGMEADPSPVAFEGSTLPGWPKFSTDVNIEWEEPIPPDPLPIRESDDG